MDQWLASMSVVSIIFSCHKGINNVILNQIMNQESMLQLCELRYNLFPTVHNMHNFQLLPNSLMFHQHFLWCQLHLAGQREHHAKNDEPWEGHLFPQRHILLPLQKEDWVVPGKSGTYPEQNQGLPLFRLHHSTSHILPTRNSKAQLVLQRKHNTRFHSHITGLMFLWSKCQYWHKEA